jgi:L-asparaginase II
VTPPPPFARLARVTRGGEDESWHFGVAAVVTPEGRLVARVGDPSVATVIRSAAKPFQSLSLLLAGGEEAFGLSDADLALICASHGGTPEHAERAAALLARGGFGPEDLRCGGHEPMDADAARALREAGRESTGLHNNCSGKHAGMLLATKLLGQPADSYLSPDHPLQRANLSRVARFCGVPEASIGISVDGCGVPAYHLPVAAAARGYAALADPDAARADGGIGGLPVSAEEAAAARRALRAMAAAPAMVAGPGRFTTRLIEATGGRVVGKEGAEGFYGVAVRGPVALGVAVKVADGSGRCRDGVVLDLLRATGSLSGDEMARLEEYRAPVRRNVVGREVGRVVPDLALERCE